MQAAKTIFTGKEPEEILELLEANCETSEIQEISIPLSGEDLEVLQEEVSELSAKFHHLSAVKKREVAKMDEVIKPIKKDLAQKSLMLHSGVKDVEETLYGLTNFDEGTMEYYRADGTLHYSRRLRRDEGQTRLTIT